VDTLQSLKHTEAIERAALISVDRYDIEVDLTGLLEGDALRAVSTIRFSCREPGATTFVDCAAEVESATLNGEPVDPSAVTAARLTLSDLVADNTLVVSTVQRATDQGTGVHRSVDATDGEVYVWTSFEPDDARRAWACFDQPDLKAPFAFTVIAPAPWLVVSSSDTPEPEDVGDARRWSFADTPALSTYVPVVNAGPFHQVRSERGGYDLGLYARRSLAGCLDRDAEELFGLTAAGLAFYGERFGLPFPERSYDQVFMPDMGGAMENYGCVTYSDAFVYRSTPTAEEREERAAVLLHEMAHMWFGDIVTMRWWDDLWLNEAFADWACYWAATAATEFTDAWAGFLAAAKAYAYAVDRGPTTHPIRQDVPDVAAAAASFDAITYIKGASALKQLVAYVGEDAFVAGLRAYFAKNAWGNATLADLMGELSRAGGRDLTEWTTGWLDTAGTDTLTLAPSNGDGYALHAAGPRGGPPRPHRLNVGVYDRDDGDLKLRDTVAVELDGPVTQLRELGGPATLLLVNDDDLTFATVRPDEGSLAELVDSAADLPTAVSRAAAVSAVWDLLITGGLPAAAFVRCATGVLAVEDVDTLVEPFLRRAVEAAEMWSPDARRDSLRDSIAQTCLVVADKGGAKRLAALRALARTAVTDDQLAALRSAATDDVDLQWRLLTRLAALDRHEAAEAEALARRDPDPDAWVRALCVEAARPDGAAKMSAWQAVVDGRKVPIGSLSELSTAFWQPSQADVLAPFSERYLDVLPALGRSAMIPAMTTSAAMFPMVGVDDAYVDRVVAVANGPDVSPVVSKRVLERADRLHWMLVARDNDG
jgi:aminopeptidase N